MNIDIKDPAADPLHPALSRTREKILEAAFLTDLSRALWRQGRRDVEVLRAEVIAAALTLWSSAQASSGISS